MAGPGRSERTEELTGNAFYKESHEHAYTSGHTHAHDDYKRAWVRGKSRPCFEKEKNRRETKELGTRERVRMAWRFTKLEKRSVSFTPQSETTFKNIYYIYIYYMHV